MVGWVGLDWAGVRGLRLGGIRRSEGSCGLFLVANDDHPGGLGLLKEGLLLVKWKRTKPLDKTVRTLKARH